MSSTNACKLARQRAQTVTPLPPYRCHFLFLGSVHLRIIDRQDWYVGVFLYGLRIDSR